MLSRDVDGSISAHDVIAACSAMAILTAASKASVLSCISRLCIFDIESPTTNIIAYITLRQESFRTYMRRSVVSNRPQNPQFVRRFARSLPENIPFVDNEWFWLKMRFKIFDYSPVVHVRHFLGQAQIL